MKFSLPWNALLAIVILALVMPVQAADQESQCPSGPVVKKEGGASIPPLEDLLGRPVLGVPLAPFPSHSMMNGGVVPSPFSGRPTDPFRQSALTTASLGGAAQTNTGLPQERRVSGEPVRPAPVGNLVCQDSYAPFTPAQRAEILRKSFSSSAAVPPLPLADGGRHDGKVLFSPTLPGEFIANRGQSTSAPPLFLVANPERQHMGAPYAPFVWGGPLRNSGGQSTAAAAVPPLPLANEGRHDGSALFSPTFGGLVGHLGQSTSAAAAESSSAAAAPLTLDAIERQYLERDPLGKAVRVSSVSTDPLMMHVWRLLQGYEQRFNLLEAHNVRLTSECQRLSQQLAEEKNRGTKRKAQAPQGPVCSSIIPDRPDSPSSVVSEPDAKRARPDPAVVSSSAAGPHVQPAIEMMEEAPPGVRAGSPRRALREKGMRAAVVEALAMLYAFYDGEGLGLSLNARKLEAVRLLGKVGTPRAREILDKMRRHGRLPAAAASSSSADMIPSNADETLTVANHTSPPPASSSAAAAASSGALLPAGQADARREAEEIGKKVR